MRTLAVFGVGLIGGSFALALRKAGFGGTILGVSSAATTDRALRLGVIDEGADEARAVAEADCIYLAQPISVIVETLQRIGPRVRPEALITDAGSTKRAIGDVARRHVKHAHFLGGHPMAGKESRGVEKADADLFHGRPYILTADDSTPRESRVQELAGWLDRIGARVVWMTEAEHDRVVAWSSHLPQLASTALSSVLERETGEPVVVAAGPGLNSQTRLALSAWDMWEPILRTNAANIDNALMAYIDELQRFRALLGGSLRPEWERASGFARRLREDGSSST